MPDIIRPLAISYELCKDYFLAFKSLASGFLPHFRRPFLFYAFSCLARAILNNSSSIP